MALCLVLSDISEWETLRTKLGEGLPICSILRWPEDEALLEGYDQWWLYTSDIASKELISIAIECDAEVILLPHKESHHTQRGFSLRSDLNKVTWDIDKRKRLECDVLRCNDEVVLNKVVVGTAFSFQPGGHKPTVRERLAVARELLFQLIHRDHQAKGYCIKTGSDTTIDTAAIGFTVTSHVFNSNLSKKLLPDRLANDGQFYSLIVSPRSVQEVFGYIVSLPFKDSVTQPGFLGIIRSASLMVKNSGQIEYVIDGEKREKEQLDVRVDEKKIKLSVEPDNDLVTAVKREKSIRRTQNLPTSKESIQALVTKKLPWITHAANDDFKELYLQVRENSKVRSEFLVMMVLSTLLASLGLYANSAPVIIGAMILAPLMAPIISLAMAFARQDERLLIDSAKTLLSGWMVAVGFAVVFSIILPMQVETNEISARLTPNLLDLGVAIISGIAGAYAHARAHVAKSLAGVAIAVALVPPLAVSGIGIGWLSWHVTTGALLLFFANMAGIVFAAALTFILLGFAPFARARRGIIIASLSVLVVSVPLGLSFLHLTHEAEMIREIESLKLDSVTIRHVKVIGSEKPLHVAFELVSSTPIDQIHLQSLKIRVEKAVGEKVILEVKPVIMF